MEKWGYENEEELEEQGNLKRQALDVAQSQIFDQGISTGPVTGLGQERGTDKPPPKGKQGPVTARGTNLPPPPPTEGRSVDEFTGDDPEFDFTDPDATPFDDPAAVNEDSTGTTPGAGKAGMHMVGGKANPSNVKQVAKLEEEEMDFDDEFDPAAGFSAPDINSDAMAATLDTASAPVLEEDHNCKSAHPGMNHDQWAGKHR